MLPPGEAEPGPVAGERKQAHIIRLALIDEINNFWAADSTEFYCCHCSPHHCVIFKVLVIFPLYIRNSH